MKIRSFLSLSSMKARKQCAVGQRTYWIFLFTTFVTFAGAQNSEVLHSWTYPPDHGPWAPLVQGSDGNFYGTTFSGWGGDPLDTPGTIFKMSPDGEVTTMFQFTRTDGTFLNGLIQGSDGNFYGTARNGGNYLADDDVGSGTFFKITPGGVHTTLSKFASGNPHPVGQLVEGLDGNFYGVTSGDGSGYFGTPTYGSLYRMTPAGLRTTLLLFNKNNGAGPGDGLVLGKDGNLYGTTLSGGAYDQGTVFKLTTNNVLTTLYDFSELAPPSAVPSALAEGDDGNFYGTTQNGGLYDANETTSYGTIFRISAEGTFTNLFLFNGSNGAVPWAGLLKGQDGNFYGTTWGGGSAGLGEGTGTVFQITPSGAFSTLVNFDGTNGYRPGSVLVQGSDGKLYGTGGTGIDGFAFRVRIPPATLPALKIVCSGESVLLSWHATATGAILERADAVSGLPWNTVGTVPIQIGDQQVVTFDLTSEPQFFRLRK